MSSREVHDVVEEANALREEMIRAVGISARGVGIVRNPMAPHRDCEKTKRMDGDCVSVLWRVVPIGPTTSLNGACRQCMRESCCAGEAKGEPTWNRVGHRGRFSDAGLLLVLGKSSKRKGAVQFGVKVQRMKTKKHI